MTLGFDERSAILIFRHVEKERVKSVAAADAEPDADAKSVSYEEELFKSVAAADAKSVSYEEELFESVAAADADASAGPAAATQFGYAQRHYWISWLRCVSTAG